MSRSDDEAAVEADDPLPEGPSRDDMELQVELLADENYRLRTELRREREQRNRRAAVGFVGLSALAVATGLLLPGAREPLFVIAAVGIGVAVYTAYLERAPPIETAVDDGVYSAVAANGSSLIDELGLQGPQVYVPLGDEPSSRATSTSPPVRLFVPQHPDYTLPDTELLESTHLVTESSRTTGVSFVPTGGALVERLRSERPDSLDGQPPDVARTLADALVDGFELLDGARVEASPGDSRITAGVNGSVLGPVDRFDHPVASFLASGLAVALEEPVVVETSVGEDGADALVVCRIESEGAPE